jgi:signal transduction histidine kinase
VSRTNERQAVQVVVLTAAWTAIYALLTILVPAGVADRPLLMDTAFLPFHPLAAWALMHACRAMPRDTPRWQGFRALMWSQVVGVVNSFVWIGSSAGILSANSALYQAVGVVTTALSIYGIARLVPLRRTGAAAVPWLDITLLLLAGAAIGWYFVGWPILIAGTESTTRFAWFAAITTADSFSALLALAAWAYPTDRIGRPASAALAASYALSALGDVVIETGTVAGKYVSGQPFDIVFAVSILCVVFAAWWEIDHRDAPPQDERAILTTRAVTPLVASAAVFAPVIIASVREQDPRALVVPGALVVSFVLVLQWRYLLLDREIERSLVSRLGLERDLALARQFESLGRFAGAIAHDFNNVLAGLLAHVQLLKRQGTGSADIRESIALMEDSVKRGVTLNSRLLSLMRGQAVDRVPTDLVSLAHAVADAVSPSVAERRRIAVSVPSGPLPVLLRPGDGDQLLLNLVVNAREASPEGGPIAIRLRSEGAEAVLEVEDEGHGIPEAIRERVFEPLFTTRAAQRGTGLGLATVQAVVTNAGGTVSLWSEEGRGTRFTVRLPRAEGPARG